MFNTKCKNENVIGNAFIMYTSTVSSPKGNCASTGGRSNPSRAITSLGQKTPIHVVNVGLAIVFDATAEAEKNNGTYSFEPKLESIMVLSVLNCECFMLFFIFV